MTSTPSDLATLRETVARFAGRRIVVWGDLMVDRYLWGRVDRISPEAPVPVVEVERESAALGGAGNVAANLAALGAVPVMLAVTGPDDGGRELRAALALRGIATDGLIEDPARPTTVKTRIVAHAQQVVRADRESRADVSGAALEALLDALDRALARCEGLVVSDYGKGVVQPATLQVAL